MASILATLSMTEVPHFRRLVEFLEAVEEYAAEECDIALQELVEDARQDLLDCGPG